LLSKVETKLLKELARVYAFVLDIRAEAIRLKNRYWVKRTEGVDKAITTLKERYPKSFARHLNRALRKKHEKGQMRTEAAQDEEERARSGTAGKKTKTPRKED